MSTENKQDDQRRCLTRLVSCGLALCEALETAGIPLTQDQAECKAYIEAWWSVDNPPPGYTSETWAAVERMISANAEDYREVSVTNGVDSSDWMDSKMEENTNG